MATRLNYCGWREREESRSWFRVQSSPVAIPPGYEFREARLNKRLNHLIVKIIPIERSLWLCPDCGARLNKNGFTFSRPKGKPDGRLRVTFMIARQKYQCTANKKHCPSEPIPGLDPNHRCFASLTDLICAQPDRTNGALAHSTGYSDKTIAAFFAEFAAVITRRQYYAVFWAVFMDEKYLDDGPHWTIGNLLSGQYITMTKDNKAETIRDELRKFKHLDKLRLILMDTNFEYGPILREFAPNARIVRDVNHIRALAYECRDQVRKAALKFARGKTKALLEKPGELWSLLDQPGAWENIGLPGELIGAEAPSLRKAHDLYVSFLAIYVIAQDGDDAVRLFELWSRGVEADLEMARYFGTLVQTVGDRASEIFGYLDIGLTNNPAESVNRQIQSEREKGRTYGWEGVRDRMACKAEVARQQAVEYIAYIEEELQQSEQDPTRPTELSETAERRRTRSIRILAGQPVVPPEDMETAELSVQAALRRSAEMAERAKRRKPRSKAQPRVPDPAQVGNPSAAAKDSATDPNTARATLENPDDPGGSHGGVG